MPGVRVPRQPHPVDAVTDVTHHYETDRACEACGTTAEYGCLEAIGCKFIDPRAGAFIADILAVYEKHGLSISHEDEHGAFIVVPYNTGTAEWLCHASVKLPPATPFPRPAPAGAGSNT